jgi:hypothetical protein
MALTAQNVVDLRRWMGYSVSGNTASQPYREPVYSNETLASLSLDYRLENLSDEETNTLTSYFIPNLTKREQEIQDAACNLDTDTAAVWKRNKDEMRERRDLFNSLRRDLCDFLGFAPGRALMQLNRLVRA